MKMIYEKAIDGNNYSKENVDEQQEDVKHFKEQCDNEDKYEVQQITAAKKYHEKNKQKKLCV